MIRALVIALLVLLGAPAWAQSVNFPSVTVGSSQAGPEVKGWVYKPPGDGPFRRSSWLIVAPVRTPTPTGGASCW